LRSFATSNKFAPKSSRQTPDKSGSPSGVLGVGAERFGLPSGVRGNPAAGWLNHWQHALADAADSRRRSLCMGQLFAFEAPERKNPAAPDRTCVLESVAYAMVYNRHMTPNLPESVRRQLDKIVSSKAFAPSSRSASLLRFVVERNLDGNADQLKEYTLGAKALGRGDGFDPRIDPIVRAEASRPPEPPDPVLRNRRAGRPAQLVFENGILDAFNITRAGGNAPLFDKILGASTYPVRVW